LARIAVVTFRRRKRSGRSYVHLRDAADLRGEDPRGGPRLAGFEDEHAGRGPGCRIRDVIDANYRVEGDLRKEISMNIKRLMDLGHTGAFVNRKGLPRGVSVHTRTPDPEGPGAREPSQRRRKPRRNRAAEPAGRQPRRGAGARNDGKPKEEREEEGPPERAGRGGPHPGDLQQHDHHDSRSDGNTLAWASAAQRGSRIQEKHPFAATGGRRGSREKGDDSGVNTVTFTSRTGSGARPRFGPCRPRAEVNFIRT